MIATVTLNASIDKAYHMRDAIKGGTVMRVEKCRNTAGGKGLNVARVATLCGASVKATGMVGGYNGSYLESLLDEDGISHEFGRMAGETRSCINVLDPTFHSTEFLEPGPEVSTEEIERFLRLFQRIAHECDVVTISGSAPTGVATDVYARMVSMARRAGKRVILDTSGALLWEGMRANPTMIKPNAEEIAALYQTTLATRDEVAGCARRIRDMGIPFVVISLGGDGALLACEEGIFHGVSPKVEVVNTVGCGDSMVAAFAVAFERGMSAADALRYAVSVATANALMPSTGSFDAAIQAEIYKKVQVTAL